MKTASTAHACVCDGSTEVVDAYNQSQTIKCATCGRMTLRIRHRDFKLEIRLKDFHVKRGRRFDQRPISDLTMANDLWRRLLEDVWPSAAQVVDFGIDSQEHYGALQHAIGCGIQPYDFDRVMGDGAAITALANGLLGQPYRGIMFTTAYVDALAFQEDEDVL